MSSNRLFCALGATRTTRLPRNAFFAPGNARGTRSQNRHGSASEIIQRHQWEAHAKGVHGCYQRTPEDGGKWHFRDFWRQLLLLFFSSVPLQNSLDSDSARREKHFDGSFAELWRKNSQALTPPPVVEPATNFNLGTEPNRAKLY